MTAPPSDPPDSPEEIFRNNLPLIKKLASLIARRHRATAEETEEFTSELMLKFLADDYAVIRKFKGTSSLKTYLTTVVSHAFLDFRDRQWGKWRASAAAKKLGQVAIWLEELVYREGWSFDEACQILWTNYKVKETRQELEEIWKQLPPRTPSRGPMGEEGELRDLPDLQLSPEDRLLIKEIQASLERIKPALKKALDRLDPDDRLFIMMVVVSGISIADAAKTLCKEQKPLYRLLKKILRHLREDLERGEAGEK